MKNKKYNKCYVAFLDILGFKNFVNNNGFEKVLDIFALAIKKIAKGGII